MAYHTLNASLTLVQWLWHVTAFMWPTLAMLRLVCLCSLWPSDLTRTIGNIGSSMISGENNSTQENIQSLGFIMMELMEPVTAATKPDLITLMNPSAWTHEIHDFQGMTQRKTSTIEVLFTVSSTNWFWLHISNMHASISSWFTAIHITQGVLHW